MHDKTTGKKIIVIGGGAAGFFGAIACAEAFPQHEVMILEKGRTVLGKVRVSGGGRCNVTHACFENRRLAQNYPRGSKAMPSILTQFDANSTVAWFEKRHVALKTEPDGRMFPTTDNSQTIVDCLEQSAKRAGVRVQTSVGVASIALVQQQPEPKFALQVLNGTTYECDRVLIATGGNPNLQGYQWLADLSLGILPPVPSLFTFNTPASPLLDLAGVSVPQAVVRVAASKLTQEGPLLITHWGFSGPAVLKLSAWGARELQEKGYRFTLLINWTPQFNEESLRQELTQFKEIHKKKTIAANALFDLPNRLWKKIVSLSEINEELKWLDLPKKNLNKLVENLVRGSFEVEGKSTFKEEFVTCGGIDLREVDLATMESRRVKGLFFAGEVLDIDGVTGGFNFQSAWTTGWIAGQHLGK